MSLIEEHRQKLGTAPLCQALKVSRASFYRQQSPKAATATVVARKPPEHALSEAERQTVLATLHEPRFLDLAPPQVYAQLLEEGCYLCSIRTMYRLLAAQDEVRERRAVTCVKQKICEDQLTLHADRGSSMKSKVVAQLLADLGVTKTHSRPQVSNDNPFSESQFKTMKYRPEFPERFGSIQGARLFGCNFFPWYNHNHRHCGLALYTPADVHYGRVQEVHQQRQAALDAAYRRHPNRFARKPPKALLPPRAVWINPPKNPENQPMN